MIQHMQELGRRAADCKGWKLAIGMRVYSPFFQVYFRVVALRHNWCLVRDPDGEGAPAVEYRDINDKGKVPWCRNNATPLLDLYDDLIPDLTDAGTVGALLALVRAAYKQPNAYACFALLGWVMRGDFAPLNFKLKAADTEVEVLVAALEAAP